MAPSEDAGHEHTLVPRLRERDLAAWEQCTGCPFRTDPYIAEVHEHPNGTRAEWTEDELVELRVRNARELEAAAAQDGVN